MLGLATGTELRLAAYGLVLAAITASYIYTHHEGYEACRAPQKAAEKSQVQKDLDLAKGTIHDLETKLAAIPVAQPPPHVFLCQSPRSMQAESPSPGAQPPLAEIPRDSPGGMPSGTAGIDIGRELQESRKAASIIAIYRDETWDWAVKQSEH